ncbi:MAG TPA: STAS domain-containing protein [Acidobacteriaceae bacterium]
MNMNVSLFTESALGEPRLASVVRLEDELVRGCEVEVLEELMPRVKCESLALDLSGVDRIDAAGIAALIRLYCGASAAGTEFSVVAPSARVRAMLRTVGLETVLIADGAPRRMPVCVQCPAA